MATDLILPHGGKLINKYIEKNYDDSKTFEVSSDIRNDAENIAIGVFSPLEGFMNQEDLLNVLKEGRLSNNIPWTVPIVLDVQKKVAMEMKDEGNVVLSSGGEKFGVMHVEEIYGYNKEDIADKVYGTNDVNHPGVNGLFKMKEFLVGGELQVFHFKEKDETQKI